MSIYVHFMFDTEHAVFLRSKLNMHPFKCLHDLAFKLV
jgi:hypothetical protein